MHCIVLGAPRGKDSWELRRSIELLGFHRENEEVRILFLLYGKNKLPIEEGENCLLMMHRGDVQCWWQPSWPLPLHWDEEDAGIEPDCSILMKLYGEAFELGSEHPKHLSRVNRLSQWDSWEDVEPEVVHRWQPSCGVTVGRNVDEKIFVPPHFPVLSLDEDVPFTSWKIGNFTKPGLFLMTFALKFSGESYRRLVTQQSQFTIDGPERLLTRTKYEVLNREDRDIWTEQLSLFEREPVLSERGYDVILLGSPLADRIETIAPSGMAQAPRQAESNGEPLAKRFITLSHDFTMLAQYINQTVDARELLLVG
jgi:hypothetical protein